MKYTYPIAICYSPNDNKKTPDYLVHIPDFDGITEGYSIADAIGMGQDWLSITLETLEDDGKEIPTPTPMEKIQRNYPECTVTLAYVDTDEYRQRYGTKSVKKTLTIPAWMNTRAMNENINFSQTLQDALMEKLERYRPYEKSDEQ